MVFVTTDAVEADLLGVLELVHILVIDEMAFLRVIQLVRNIDPHRVIFFAEIIRQIRPRHQIEPCKLHAILLT